MKRFLGLAAALLLSLGLTLGLTLSASAATRPIPATATELGGLNLAGYCASLGDTVVVPNPVTGTNAAKHWRCKPPGAKSVKLNLRTACAVAYPPNSYLLNTGDIITTTVAAHPFIQDVNDAYSIVCVVKTSTATISPQPAA